MNNNHFLALVSGPVVPYDIACMKSKVTSTDTTYLDINHVVLRAEYSSDVAYDIACMKHKFTPKDDHCMLPCISTSTLLNYNACTTRLHTYVLYRNIF